MPIGYSDLKKVISLPGTWDLDYLKKWETIDGMNWSTLVQRLGAALVLFNSDMRTGYLSQFLRDTTELSITFPIGGSGDLQAMSEYGRPDPIHGARAGTMIPLKDYGGALGWTYMALRRARSEQLEADIRELIHRAENTWEKAVLTRMFKMEADTVGAAGKSVPLADGGTVDSTFIPPSFDGQEFASSHDHFIRVADTATGRSSSIATMADHLKEHGIPAPWDLIIPDADKALWAAQTEFKKPERGAFSTAGVETRGLVDEESYIGLIEASEGWFRVRASARLPANYAGAFKPYGFGGRDNPIVIRVEEGYPLGIQLVGQIDQFPLQEADAYFTFGAGIGNRLAGVCAYFAASADYITPTIT